MGKGKKGKVKKAFHKSHPYAPKNKNLPPRDSSETRQPILHRLAPTIPFNQEDRILLIGEGDFSFAHSLLTHHACTSITATTLESQADLAAKHPQASAYIASLEAEDHRVLYSIDATKLGSPHGGGGNALKKMLCDRIIFNFPHTGGLTKDINRQVRANQELLVKFLSCAKPLLADGGAIIVTVFEGQPYELWNLRDLARHSGLKVGRSFKFQASAYPGYKHARTLGNMEGGGKWKGEDRAARTYCFQISDANAGHQPSQGKTKDSDDEEDG